jgi:putative oligomerization/nucleic acid binding protein
VTYHGGFSYLAVTTSRMGRLVLGDESVTLDRIPHETLTSNFDPPIELCRTRAIRSIEVTSEQVARSKIGAAALFGVLGAVTAKGAEDRATMIFALKSGEPGYFTVKDQSVPSLLGVLTPWMREHAITSGSTEGSIVKVTAPRLIADELAKLAQLRDAGVLSDDEFLALKTQLIQEHTGSVG